VFKFVLSFVFLLPAIAHAQGPKPDKLTIYKTVGDVELKLHVFQPPADDSGQGKRSAIVFFFGGGWVGGTPTQFYSQSRILAERGMVACSAEYRVRKRNKTTPFECVKDGKSAIRWVREHADDLGIDADRIVAGGGSAGGHVAACTAVIEGVEEEGEDTKISSVPNALILFNPVLDTTEKGYGSEKFDADQQTTLSPCHHVRAGIVPTLIFHGDADKVVPFENAERFDRLLKEAGNQSTLMAFEGKGHGFFNIHRSRASQRLSDHDATMAKAIEFLTSHGFITETALQAK